MLAAATEQEAIEEAIAAIHAARTPPQDDAEGKIVALLADRAIDADAEAALSPAVGIHPQARAARRHLARRLPQKHRRRAWAVDNTVNLPLAGQLLLAWWWEQSARQDHSIALGNALG